MNVLSLFLHNTQGFEMWDIMGKSLRNSKGKQFVNKSASCRVGRKRLKCNGPAAMCSPSSQWHFKHHET